jgi:hypothetical protein
LDTDKRKTADPLLVGIDFHEITFS